MGDEKKVCRNLASLCFTALGQNQLQQSNSIGEPNFPAPKVVYIDFPEWTFPVAGARQVEIIVVVEPVSCQSYESVQ